MKIVAEAVLKPIRAYVEQRISEFSEIPEERRMLLRKTAEYVAGRIRAGQPADLIYICTHNSRRSHFGQIWAAVAAHYYNVRPVRTWSGGTEATAFHPNAIAALRRVGFVISPESAGSNPVYQVSYDLESDPLPCFSKIYNDPRNPQHTFAAVMTCSEAEHNCPLIPGADVRIALTYNDPKVADNTPEESSNYDARCKQIAREALWLFSQIS